MFPPLTVGQLAVMPDHSVAAIVAGGSRDFWVAGWEIVWVARPRIKQNAMRRRKKYGRKREIRGG